MNFSDEIREAYEDVRNDDTETTWALLEYHDKTIELKHTGTDYDELISSLQDDQRAYGYIRFQVGDELSKRAKFVLMTWVGPEVSPLKKAKVSTDKAFVKNVFQQYQMEVLADDKNELRKEEIENKLRKAGGANYGTGSRE